MLSAGVRYTRLLVCTNWDINAHQQLKKLTCNDENVQFIVSLNGKCQGIFFEKIFLAVVRRSTTSLAANIDRKTPFKAHMLLLLPFLTCGAGLLTVTNGLELGDKYTVECDDFPKCSHLRLCADNTDTTRLFKRQSAIRGSVNNLTFTAATLTSTTLSEPAAPQSGQQSYNVQSADGMIQYQLLCTTPSAMTTPSVSDPADFCKNAIAAFALAGDYLSNLLSITVPIQVTGRIHSFCEAPNDGSASITADRCGSILGFAKPAAFFRFDLI